MSTDAILNSTAEVFRKYGFGPGKKVRQKTWKRGTHAVVLHVGDSAVFLRSASGGNEWSTDCSIFGWEEYVEMPRRPTEEEWDRIVPALVAWRKDIGECAANKEWFPIAAALYEATTPLVRPGEPGS